MIEFVYPHTHLVAGVDEVGRGPLVGAVVTAAVILDPARPIVGLNDSKKLSEKRRLSLYDEIKEKALSWSLGRAEAHEIDELNILHATMLAMQRAVAGLHIAPEYVPVSYTHLFLSMALRSTKAIQPLFIWKSWHSMARRRTTDAVLRLLNALWDLCPDSCIEKSEDV